MSGRNGALSRQQQAFRMLLASDEDDPRPQGGPRPAKGSGSKGKGRRSGGGGGSGSGGRIPGFQLRSEAVPPVATGRSTSMAGSGGDDQLASLQEAFTGVLPPDLVADVLASCGGDAAAAMEALLAMSGGSGEGQGAAVAAEQSQVSAVQAAAEPASKSTAAAAAAAAAAGTPSSSSGPCYWDVLPTECKELIFQLLTVRDLARAARACREFAAYVREQRRTLRTVIVPEGVSPAAVRGLVSAFAGAPAVNLSRCAGSLRFQHEFESIFEAVARGEADRPVGSVPVSEISLARCGHATDGVVAALCDTLPHLRRVDLARCAEVSDAALSRLAAYARQLDSNSTAAAEGLSDEEEQGGGMDSHTTDSDAAELAAAGVQGMQLSPPSVQAAAEAVAAAAPGLESPESAVKRIAVQRHATMMARTAAAARAQHGRQQQALGLEELCLKETSVSARGTKLLLQPGSATSKSLKVLDVSRCPNVGGDALDLHPRAVLEVLRASGCTALRSVVIQLPPDAPLRTLQLDGCRQLTEVVLVAHRLESANFSHCGQLRTVSLRCRRLRELRAVNCGSLNLAASEAQCPELREVNLFGCRQLDAEGLEALAPSLGKCCSLDLSGCTSLSRMLLPEATALQSVSVAGCGVLRQVLLASPALSYFRATGCSRLVDLRLGTASLSLLDLENCAHLREVQLSAGDSALAAAAAAAGGGQWARDATGRVAQHKAPALVLRGCAALSDDAKKRLRSAVLGG